jgi:2-polyprenyl-3-methyl-5-hydroxy-6-metoxy-1,4-benzoquinol methylase
VITDKEFADAFLATYNWKNESYINLHLMTARAIKLAFHPDSVLDYGCGIGATVVPLLDMGIDSVGYDPNVYLYEHFIENFPQYKEKFVTNWEQVKEKHFDVFFCCEVMEHMTDEQIIETMKGVNCETIVFSSTPHKTTPEQDEDWGHINVKSHDEWLTFFKQFGYKFVCPMGVPTSWTKVFKHV